MNNFSTINNQSSLTQFANMQKDINWLKENKKQEIKKNYEEDMKKHKTGFAMLCVTAVVGLTGFFFCKQERGLTGLMGFGSLLGLLFTPVLKPKKEKYEAAMQKELNEVV